MGIVYIMNDDSLSPVFNLRGCSFEKIGPYQHKGLNMRIIILLCKHLNLKILKPL